MYVRAYEHNYEEIIYDLNELSKLVGKPGEKYFDRIVKNLDKIMSKFPVYKEAPSNK